MEITFNIDGGKVFWIIALTTSLVMGFSSRYVFQTEDQRNSQTLALSIWLVWFNFVGSFIGWILLSVFLKAFMSLNIQKINLVHYIYLLTGAIGIMGLLPKMMYAIVDTAGEILAKIVRFILPQKN